MSAFTETKVIELQDQLVTFIKALTGFASLQDRVVREANGSLVAKVQNLSTATGMLVVVQTPDIRQGEGATSRRAHVLVRFEERRKTEFQQAWPLAYEVHDALALHGDEQRPWAPEGFEAVEFSESNVLVDVTPSEDKTKIFQEQIIALQFSTQYALPGGGY